MPPRPSSLSRSYPGRRKPSPSGNVGKLGELPLGLDPSRGGRVAGTSRVSVLSRRGSPVTGGALGGQGSVATSASPVALPPGEVSLSWPLPGGRVVLQ